MNRFNFDISIFIFLTYFTNGLKVLCYRIQCIKSHSDKPAPDHAVLIWLIIAWCECMYCVCIRNQPRADGAVWHHAVLTGLIVTCVLCV